jgi:hypothetical protein
VSPEIYGKKPGDEKRVLVSDRGPEKNVEQGRGESGDQYEI